MPKITIIIPVYNVEQYLRQCLDSVVNQTMQDIQIICVNDGSTDGSPAILEEYAAKDPRMEVIHQRNQGSAAARNNAQTYIRGKYTYFVDSDDWIDPDLCQQCWDRAEATEADFVMLRCIVHHFGSDFSDSAFDPTLPQIRQSPDEKYELLGWIVTYQRFWRSDFLLSNKIRFFGGPDGKCPCDDHLPSWKGTVLANRIALLDVPLYHLCARLGSQQQTLNEAHFSVAESMAAIEKMLHETESWGTYKDFFLISKFRIYRSVARRLPPALRVRFVQHVRQSLTETDHAFFRSASRKCLPSSADLCYLWIVGNRMGAIKYRLSEVTRSPRLLFRRWIVKPIEKWLKGVTE
jgi:glycosyltransferase involved in cell wall biosynthesis